MQKQKKKTAVSEKIKMRITEELLEKCRAVKKNKKNLSIFLTKNGFNSKQICEIKKALAPNKNFPEIKSQKAENWESNLKFTEKYIYNNQDDKYIMYLRAANSNIVLPGDVVRGIKESYSNWIGEEYSINEICRNYKIPRNYLTEILRILGITHDSEPITDEQLAEKDVEAVTEDLLQKKKFQLYQEFQKRSWKETEEAAAKWFKMQEGVLNPFVNFINLWNPPHKEPVKYTGPSKKQNDNRSLLVGLSDVHFGAKANSKQSYRKKSYSSEEAARCIQKYATDIKKIVENRNYGIDECVLTSLGDILHTTGQGHTTKGTMLVHDCIKEEQFTIAFNTLVYLVDSLLSIFKTVKVKSVKGNHNDFGDWVLFKSLEAYYRSEPRIAFDVFHSDHGLFKIKSTLFVISHGYSAEYKGRLPGPGKARESYVANLFLSKPEELIGVNQKVLITADQHHLEMKEYAEFEHYMLSTTVRGDQHSEAMGLNNLARQSCFVIDDSGIGEIVYCYNRG